MLTARFDRLFNRLTGAFVGYDDASRDPNHLATLLERWLALDEARTDIRAERLAMGLEPSTVRVAPNPTPDDPIIFQVSHISN